GHVLGLNDQIQTNAGSSSGVGFALPSNTVSAIANEIIPSPGQQVQHPYVGVSPNQDSVGGAAISNQPYSQGRQPVVPGSPAAAAGLKPNDLITAINGQAITSPDPFIATVD